MNILTEIAIIFTICTLAEGISGILPFPLPGNIIGMILLFLLLSKQWIKVESIENMSQFLLKNMAFLFIPTSLGIVAHIETIKDEVWAILFVCLASTLITFGVTGWVAQGMIRYQKKKRGKVNG